MTGQEQEKSDDSTHVACTIEMTNLTGHNGYYDCAVIDEFQLIGDESRGSVFSMNACSLSLIVTI